MSSSESDSFEPNGIPLAGGVKPVIDDCDSTSYTSPSPSFKHFNYIKTIKEFEGKASKTESDTMNTDEDMEEDTSAHDEDSNLPHSDEKNKSDEVCPSANTEIFKSESASPLQDDIGPYEAKVYGDADRGCIFYYRFPGSNHAVVVTKVHQNWVIELQSNDTLQSWFMLGDGKVTQG